MGGAGGGLSAQLDGREVDSWVLKLELGSVTGGEESAKRWHLIVFFFVFWGEGRGNLRELRMWIVSLGSSDFGF